VAIRRLLVELGRVDAGWSSRRRGLSELEDKGVAADARSGGRRRSWVQARCCGERTRCSGGEDRAANRESPLPFLCAQGPSYGRISFTKREPSSCQGMVISAIACLVG
jgi:hypothetical protein